MTLTEDIESRMLTRGSSRHGASYMHNHEQSHGGHVFNYQIICLSPFRTRADDYSLGTPTLGVAHDDPQLVFACDVLRGIKGAGYSVRGHLIFLYCLFYEI